LLGIDEYLRVFHGDTYIEGILKLLSERLLELYRRARRDDFTWFEDRLTYCNARLPQALLVAGASIDHDEMIDAGLECLNFLVSEQHSSKGYFAPIGTNGFYVSGGSKAHFDQQPVEACATIAACFEAQRVTGDAVWAERARSAFAWFFGENDLEESLYDPLTGGCRDGLHSDRVNENQGAESTLSFLLSLLEMRASQNIAGTNVRAERFVAPSRTSAKHEFVTLKQDR
jgi:hypothetical protein